MSGFKRLIEDILELYREGSTILAIARQLNLNTTMVTYVVNSSYNPTKE